MPQMLSNNTIFIVDGDMEQEFVRRTCVGSVVRRTNLNGRSVSIPALADRVETLIRAQGNRLRYTVLLFDREQRAETPDELVNAMVDELKNRGFDVNDMVIGCADRCIEGWIAQDVDTVNKYLDEAEPYEPPTSCGKGFLASLFRAKRRSYGETTDGVKLLTAMKIDAVTTRMPCAKSFFQQLDIPCWWLKREAAQE